MKQLFVLMILLTAGLLWGQALRLVVPIGHTSNINSVAFSPDGKTVLTGSGDNTAKLWDLTGREIQTFKGHTSYVHSVAFSPDGKTVLTGSEDRTAKLWDLKGREIHRFQGHANRVNSVAFSADGMTVLTGSGDNTAKLWDLTGREIQTLYGHTSEVRSVAFSPDGKMVLTGSDDHTAKLWDFAGQEIQTFKGHTSEVRSVAFSPDGNTLLTGSNDYTAKLWNLSGHEIQTFKGHTYYVNSVAFSPDGNTVLTAGEAGDMTAKLWNLSGQEIQTFADHASFLCSVAFSPDGKMVLMGTQDKMAKLWDLSGHLIQTFKGYANAVFSMAFSPDGKMVLTGGETKALRLWNLPGREIQTFNENKTFVESVAFSPDGKAVLTSNWDNVKLWNLSGREIQIFKGHTSSVHSVAFSPDGKMVLTGGEDKTVRLWNLSGQEIQTFTDYPDAVYSVAFSPDGRSVLTTGYGKVAKLRDLSGREIQSFEGNGITSVAFSPDGKSVLTGNSDMTARLWNLSGQEIQTCIGHENSVGCVAFSPDGKRVLTGSTDHMAKLWDVTGWETQTLAGHASPIYSVAFSPDNKTILTSSSDNTIKLWSSDNGQELLTLITIDSNDWAVTTPSGLFDASPGAMKLMYYVQGLDVIELEQLKERYYEPGLLAKIMGFEQSELRNVAAFNQVALYPEIKASIEKSQLAIQLTERNGGMGKLSLFINDKEVQEDVNPQRLKTLNLDLNAFAKYYQTDTTNTIALRAYNQEGWLKSQAYELTYNLPKSPGLTPPHLYAIVVGTSNYSGEKLDLRFADQDAAAMSQALRDASGALFGPDRTSVHLLASTLPAEPCAKTNIRQAFADIAAKATPADVLVIYFSGHGLAYGEAEKAQFYYLTKDIGSEDLSDPVVRDNYTISSNEFTQWLTAIPAQKQVMILDACNAGKVVESLAALAQKNLDPSQIRALDRMKDRTGMFILTGSAADKVSYEASQYGQGLLTYSLLQGMSGLALTEDKRVDVMTLFQFVRDKVPELAKGIGGVQTPVLAFPAGGASFDIGIVNEGVKIPVAVGKPVFIRNNFQEENAYDDVLGLTKALADYFEQATVKGAQAELIYVDVNEYENAYSMKGRYTIKGDVVVVRGKLFQGKEPKGDFEVQGNRQDVPGLVGRIVGKVSGMIK